MGPFRRYWLGLGISHTSTLFPCPTLIFPYENDRYNLWPVGPITTRVLYTLKFNFVRQVVTGPILPADVNEFKFNRLPLKFGQNMGLLLGTRRRLRFVELGG